MYYWARQRKTEQTIGSSERPRELSWPWKGQQTSEVILLIMRQPYILCSKGGLLLTLLCLRNYFIWYKRFYEVIMPMRKDFIYYITIVKAVRSCQLIYPSFIVITRFHMSTWTVPQWVSKLQVQDGPCLVHRASLCNKPAVNAIPTIKIWHL